MGAAFLLEHRLDLGALVQIFEKRVEIRNLDSRLCQHRFLAFRMDFWGSDGCNLPSIVTATLKIWMGMRPITNLKQIYFNV